MVMRPGTSPKSTSSDPAPPSTDVNTTLLVLAGLLLLAPVPVGAFHVWCRWTTAREISTGQDWLRKAPGIIDDARKYWNRNGEFDISEETRGCLCTFTEGYSRRVLFYR